MSELKNYPIVNLLPHDPPMVLLDGVENYDNTSIHTYLTIQPDTLFLEANHVPAYIALEYMAQTIAAWRGLMGRQQNQSPKIGFLLGARQLVLYVPIFTRGERLDIHGCLSYSDGEIAAFDCWVEIAGKCVAKAGLNVFQPKEGRDFLDSR